MRSRVGGSRSEVAGAESRDCGMKRGGILEVCGVMQGDAQTHNPC